MDLKYFAVQRVYKKLRNMKPILSSGVLFFILTGFFFNSSCKGYNELKKKPLEIPSVKWMVTELTFKSSRSYTSSFNDVDLDVIFTHINGTALRIPAFWDNGDTWKVRFAPTILGEWSYKAVCSDSLNMGLNNKTGNLTCVEYNGDLDIYKHGFIKTMINTRYFLYDDGTPFFYLGDTHWNIAANSLNNFKTIINKRVVQGFSVCQSEPIEAKYNLSDGLTSSDILGFTDLDNRFKYLAEKGLVHTNAQLFFASELGHNRAKYSDKYLEKLCRYWVARYSAYPVMWTTAQEVDNDMYHGRLNGNGQDDNPYYDSTTNPWKLVAGYIKKYDAYRHPQTAHMEYVSFTSVSNSSFKNLQGHTWFGVQWAPEKIAQLDFKVPKDFWNNGQGKPAPNYEGLYDHLWTLEFGARMQGWTAFLNGMYGIGYGAADIWLYNSTYDMDKPTVRDGITISATDKQTKWNVSLEFPSAYQMGYMHKFFKEIEWFNLIPRFDDPAWFSNNGSFYSVASKNNELYVAYFYNTTNRNTGTLKNLANAQYTLQWYNPIINKYDIPITITVVDGNYTIGNKPDNNDWILLVKKK